MVRATVLSCCVVPYRGAPFGQVCVLAWLLFLLLFFAHGCMVVLIALCAVGLCVLMQAACFSLAYTFPAAGVFV